MGIVGEQRPMGTVLPQLPQDEGGLIAVVSKVVLATCVGQIDAPLGVNRKIIYKGERVTLEVLETHLNAARSIDFLQSEGVVGEPQISCRCVLGNSNGKTTDLDPAR